MPLDHDPEISIDPAVMVGKPVITGTRLPVAFVLAKLAANPDLDELRLDYPELTIDDIKAVLRYAVAAVEATTDASAHIASG